MGLDCSGQGFNPKGREACVFGTGRGAGMRCTGAEAPRADPEHACRCCEDMCKEVGAYPKCTCPGFVAPDATPGVMTWDELLEHMDNLSEWGHGELKSWTAAAKALIQKGVKHVSLAQGEEQACAAQEQRRRAQIQNMLAGACE